VGTWYRLVISSLLFFMPFDRLTLSVVSITLLLKKRWMLLISLGSIDSYVYLERCVCLIKETVLSGLLLFGDAVVRPFLGKCEAHDPCVPSSQSMGKEELTTWLSVYQLSRDMVPRGIVEVIWDD
jgi:hypothetical protein